MLPGIKQKRIIKRLRKYEKYNYKITSKPYSNESNYLVILLSWLFTCYFGVKFHLLLSYLIHIYS